MLRARPTIVSLICAGGILVADGQAGAWVDFLTASLPGFIAPRPDSSESAVEASSGACLHNATVVRTSTAVSRSTVEAGSLPVAVNGASSPELIPDQLAYRHFFAVIAGSSVPTVEESARQSALISRIGLTPTDKQRLVAAVRGLRDELMTIEALSQPARDGIAPSSPLGVSARDSYATALDAAMDRARGALTLNGSALLQQFIRERVKRRIVIYGAVPTL